MVFIYTNKLTGKQWAFGSLAAFSQNTGFKVQRFYTHFGRKKKTEYESEMFKLVKTEIIRSTK